MSDSRYSYDESGEIWPYYVATLLGSVILPVTAVRLFSAASGRSSVPAVRDKKAYNATSQGKYLAFKGRGELLRTSTVLLILGWLLFSGTVYVIMTSAVTEVAREAFDPWEVLGISIRATAKEIKSAYRKQSLQFHPDKIRNLGNMTVQEVEARYVDITKAYKALTDEITMENFRLYGHPDGPQQTSHGIGLPSFLVGGAWPVVIAAYGILGVWGPLKLSRWWYRQLSRTRGGLKSTTATAFFDLCAKEQLVFMSQETILDEVLARGADEYKDEVPHLSLEQRRELIDAHLERQAVSNEIDKLRVVEVTLHLLKGLLAISEEFKMFLFVQRVIDLQRSLVQAVPVRLQRLGTVAQLPGVDFACIKAGKPQAIDGAQKAAQSFLPVLKLVKVFGKVPGLPVVIPGSKPFLVLKFLVTPLGVPPPQIPEEELELLLEDDIDTVSNSAVAAVVDPMAANKKGPKLPNVHSSYYPGKWTPSWHAYVVNERDPRFVSIPVEFSHVDLNNLKLSTKELSNGENITLGTFVIQFFSQMPSQLGHVRFRLKVLNTGYFGVDIDERISIELKNAPPVAESQENEEAPEEDEEEEKNESDVESDLSDIDTDTEDEEDETVA